MKGARGIYNAATEFIKSFKEGYEANMCWLSEVHEEALRIVNSPTVCLPRTPGTKKVKRTFAHIGTWNQESTFHEGSEKKKLKIDDFSTINDISMVDTSISNASRTLRPRPQRQTGNKAAIQKKQSKRIGKKTDDGKDEVQSIVTSQAFIPPATVANIYLHTTPNDSTLKLNNHGTHSKKMQSTQAGLKLFKKVDFGDTIIKNSDALFTDTCLEGKNEEDVLITDTCIEGKNEDALITDTCVEGKNEEDQEANRNSGGILSKNTLINDSRVEDTLSVSTTVNDTIEDEPDANTKPVSSSTPDIKGRKETKVIQASLLDNVDAPTEPGSPRSPSKCGMSAEESEMKSPGEVSYSLPQSNDDTPPAPGSAENQEHLSNKGNYDDADQSDIGRRGTYKIMVNNIIDGPPKKPSPEIDKNALPAIASNAPNTGSGNRMGKDINKVPKVIKPVRGGNIVSNIKTFIRRPESPKQTEADNEAKKVLLKQKPMEEIQKKKQQQLEERKRQQEDREKRFAEQQKRLQEEEETKRKQLKLKAAQIEKNQEEIRKMREQEQKKKRELREIKKAELDARRQREEEERNRKALELIEDERIKKETLQRKAELEEQKRLELKAEKEMLGKEKLRKIEEYKMYDEERLKREFEEKEKHRLEVERKRKEEKEKERLERQVREERNKQAEKDIADAKKLEDERTKRDEERTKREEERIRREEARKRREEERIKAMEEAKEKARALAKEKKLILGKPVNTLRSSPRLKASQNCPVVPLVQRDSSAFVNYGLDDFDSGDSTDDDCAPAKRVPSWAIGSRLNKQLMRQFYTNIEPDEIFVNAMQPLRLEIIFNKSKTRYFKRTSSAHWGSPPIKSIFKPRQ